MLHGEAGFDIMIELYKKLGSVIEKTFKEMTQPINNKEK